MHDFEITFLGTGTSVGIPVIGCDCPVCSSDQPRNRRTRCSIGIRTPEASWIVDTGPDLRQQCLREGIRELDAVLITHTHADHIMGFDDLRRFCAGGKKKLPIYATPQSLETLARVFSYAFNGENPYPGYLHPDPRPVEGDFLLGKTQITPLPVAHGKVETVGYLFQRPRSGKNGAPVRIAYLPDCKTAPARTMETIHGADVLIVDALRRTPHPTHMNFEEALEFAGKAAAANVWFTHIACEIDHEPAEKALPANVRIAYDGLRLTF